MKVKRVLISDSRGHQSKEILGRTEYAPIFTKENCDIGTAYEDKTNTGENQLWIMDEKGENLLFTVNDVRLVGIYAVIMRFTGYLGQTHKKFKAGTKVTVSVFCHEEK
jgi:hypothetical protein